MMTTDELLTRHIGGENTRRRGRLTGTVSKTRLALLILIGLGTAVAVAVTHSIWVIIGGVLAAMTALLVTIGGQHGSLLDRRRRSARMRARRATGTDAFVPYDIATWDQLTAAVRSGEKKEQQAARRALRRMRWAPDGADGMGWLVSARGAPAVAWHSPRGEEEYLSVVFSVTGQMRGIESTARANDAAEAWGRFQANRASEGSLLRGVQTLTRVLPPAAARQSRWAQLELDQNDGTWTSKFVEAFERMKASYEEVLLLCTEDAMTQRHFIICKWPVSGAFRERAAAYGEGRDGWRRLMDEEIPRAAAGLSDARLGKVRVLEAREVVALMRHQQNPSLGIEAAKRIDPLASPGLPSHDEFSAHIVEDVEPDTGRRTQWFHRTAAILAENMQDQARDPFWMLKVLHSADLQMVRSVAFHLRFVPAVQARADAQQTRVLAAAERIARENKTGLEDGTLRLEMTGAEHRAADVAPGTGHHGVEWVGFVTISARSLAELKRASSRLEDVCATDVGIARLDWQDSFAAAASGCTYPIARGQKPPQVPIGSRIEAGISGRRQKEALT
ncbi:MAG: hypothetical protein HDR73_12675 [Clavibacter sp.]|uniref:Membrane protein n=2 Tax=Microbacteriaceae TaxID=85023 RepID=B0RJ08_CLASE|nr:hypothetical protein [Clavibacter sp.]OQJ45046.1 hypothetical protein B5P19_15755 [Clavibacter sepedonicus]OQJ45097.1 hypothetical protein B5P19_16055 [Clavibacter sepedonicus]OQJ50930.1 hypothetical protein B5P20_15995 [Clavibacter sepedonicus]CAQ03196.1 putative membrane protein [Clavibacter sepedonicus]